MATDESKISFDQPRSTFGMWLGIVLLFIVFGVFVWVVMGAMPRGNNYEEERAQARLEKLKTAREEYAKAREGYGWVDKEKGVARIPVSRAMEITVAELAQRKPAPAGPLPPGGDKVGMQVTAPVTPPPAPTAQPGQTTPPPTAVTGKDSAVGAQPAAAANPPDAPPGTQPGPNTAPPSGVGSAATEPQTDRGNPGPTPNQAAPGPALPVPGKDPLPTVTPSPARQP